MMDPASVRVAQGVHACLRRVLPATFRRQHEEAMAATFGELARARWRERGWAGVAATLAIETMDVVGAAVRVRMGLRRDRPSGHGGGMGRIGADVRHTVRLWRRSPGLTAVMVCTLALGIGAATAMWTIADGVLFRPLPHEDPDQLVWIAGTSPDLPGARLPLSYPNFEDLRSDPGTGFQDMAVHAWPRSATVVISGAPDALRTASLGGNMFTLLGNRAAVGRTLLPSDAEAGAAPVVVLADGVWRTRFGGRRDVLGEVIRIDGAPHEIVGVMPARFAFPSQTVELWVPLRAAAASRDRDTNYLGVVGRLAEGVTVAEATPRIQAAMARLVAAHPDDNAGKGVRLTPRHEQVTGQTRPVMLLFAGAAGLLLLLACANLANLQLARASVRAPELALRAALGAGRRRLIAQLLTENALLVVVGGTLGLLLASLLMDVLLSLAPSSLPRRAEIVMDGRAIGFATAATLVCGVLFGLLPALRTAQADPGAALREAGRGSGGARRYFGLRGLVVAQLAMALVLVSGGGLLAHSFVRLVSVDPGFEPDGVYTFRLAPPASRYESIDDVYAFHERVLEALTALPGVSSVGATWALPFTEHFASGRVTVEGMPLPHGEEPTVVLVPVRGAYFEAMRLPLVAGRLFTDADHRESPPVVVINETTARRFWPGEDPVGKRLRRGRADENDLPWITVVGVVRDARRSGLASEVPTEMYWNHVQAGAWARDMTFAVRTEGSPSALANPVREIVRRFDPEMAITDAGPLTDRIAGSVAEPRFRALLLAAFSTLALLLAVVGTYGVMAFVVAQRRHEIGVRMALGADRRRVLHAVLGDGAKLVAFAAVLGLAGAGVAARALRGLLFGVGPFDPLAHGTALLLLAGCALVACWLPARRASRADPLSALRN